MRYEPDYVGILLGWCLGGFFGAYLGLSVSLSLWVGFLLRVHVAKQSVQFIANSLVSRDILFANSEKLVAHST